MATFTKTITPSFGNFYYVSGFGFKGNSDIVKITSMTVTFSYTDHTDSTAKTATATITDSTAGSKYIDLAAPFSIDPKSAFTLDQIDYTADIKAVHPMGIKRSPPINFYIYGVQDSEYDSTKVVITSNISKYTLLLGLAEGPIEGYSQAKLGDTIVDNSDGSVTSDNFELAITPGYSYAEMQGVLETAISLGAISSPEDYLDNMSLWSLYRNKNTALAFTGTTAAQKLQELVYSYGIGDPELNKIFSGTTHSYKLATTALNWRTCYNAINIDLDPIVTDLSNTFDKYPEEAILNLDFPGGVVEYDEGIPVATTLEFGIQYYNTTTATYESQASSANISTAQNIVVAEGDTGFISTLTEGDINYKKIVFKVKNNGGLRIHLHLKDIPEEVRRIKLFRITHDAVASNPAWGYSPYTALSDNVNDNRISAGSISQYQLRYNNTKSSYAHTALLGVKAIANSTLNSTFPTVSTEIYGKRLDYIPKCRPDEDSSNFMQVYTEDYGTSSPSNTWSDSEYLSLDNSASGNWKKGFSTNPVWCLLDLLLNTRYGLGSYISATDIDLESFFDAAQFCDDKLNYALYETVSGTSYIARYSLNMTIDLKMPARTLIDSILKTFRGLLFWSDGNYVLKVDKATSTSQILNDSQFENISYNFKAPITIPNALELRFIDQLRDSEQYTIYLEDATNIALSDGAIRSQNIVLAGVTNRQQAMSLAKYHMYTAQNIYKSINVTASIDLLSVELWDVVKIHTSKFLNEATYSSIISSISAATPSGTSYSYDLILKRLPIQFDSDASTYSFAIQSYTGGSVTLFEGSITAGATDTDTYNVTIISDSATLDSTISTDDKFTIYGNTSSYDTWRVVSISLNPASNIMNIGFINYVSSYYDDLDTYDTPHYFSTINNTDLLPNGVAYNYKEALDDVTFKVSTYLDTKVLALRIILHAYFDIPAEATNNIQKIIMLGRWRSGTSEEFSELRTLAVNESVTNPGITASGLEPGLWEFQFQLLDMYGRLFHSDKIAYSLTEGALPVDTGQTVANSTALQTGLLDPAGTNVSFSFVTATYIESKWVELPNLVSFIEITYTDAGTSPASDTFGYPVARNEDGAIIIQQNLKELTNYYPSYTLTIKYIDIYGYSYTASSILVANPAPTAPNAIMFTVDTDETRIYVSMNSVLYNAYRATELDFIGFKLVLEHEWPASSGTWISSSYDFRKGVVDYYGIMNTLGASTLQINVYVIAVDAFDQTSASVLLGEYTVTESGILSRDELASEFLGDSISLNMLRNSSFEQGNDT